eukprot:GHUV01052986.1.p1 GENE.GHUV01052986.1~~GHUV01052986.1.p1  ORF type:complete len:131 (-),score=25.27 GHUV01052986.1:17-409(-)
MQQGVGALQWCKWCCGICFCRQHPPAALITVVYLPGSFLACISTLIMTKLPSGLQAFELVQGNLVRFTTHGNNVPTAVLVHGILGSRRNLHSFAKKIVEVRIVQLRRFSASIAVDQSLAHLHHTEASSSQ